VIWFAALVVVVAVGARVVAVPLWRAGWIGDGALFGLSIARFPAITFAVGLILRVPLPLLVLLTVISLVPGLVRSRVIHDPPRGESARR
jgi:hypothetical protein